LIGQEILDEIGLFEAGSDILNTISPAELQRVFRSWIDRIERVIATEGDDIGQQMFASQNHFAIFFP
jgi:hypothetical protein